MLVQFFMHIYVKKATKSRSYILYGVQSIIYEQSRIKNLAFQGDFLFMTGERDLYRSGSRKNQSVKNIHQLRTLLIVSSRIAPIRIVIFITSSQSLANCICFLQDGCKLQICFWTLNARSRGHSRLQVEGLCSYLF